MAGFLQKVAHTMNFWGPQHLAPMSGTGYLLCIALGRQFWVRIQTTA